MTTYQIADQDVLGRLASVMEAHHPRLHQAQVMVIVLMALNPEGNAVTHSGYPCLACIKPLRLRDRVTKNADAELLIDESEWNQLRDEQQNALLDHELSHLDTVDAKEGEIGWQVDDLGRPKLRSVKGDFQPSDAFERVIARHGTFAVEYLSIERAKIRADAARGYVRLAGVQDMSKTEFIWTGDASDEMFCRSVPGYRCHVECMSDGKDVDDPNDREHWFAAVTRTEPKDRAIPDRYVLHNFEMDINALTVDAAKRLCEVFVLADIWSKSQ